MKVSVIVPVYKAEKYLAQCVNSLLAQTYPNIEIILVNDGSPDKSGEICEKYQQEHPSKIKYFFQENKGASVARNIGIEAASGDRIMFADSDDWINPQMIEAMMKLSDSADIVACGYVNEYSSGLKVTFDFDKLHKHKLEHNDKFELFKNRLVTTSIRGFGESADLGMPWGKIYRKDFIGNIRFSSEIIISEDSLFNLYAFQEAKSVILCKGAFYHYRMHESQITKRYNEAIFDSCLKFLEEVRIFTDRHYPNEKEIYNVWAVYIFQVAVNLTYVLKNSPYTLIQRINGINKAFMHDAYYSAFKNVSLKHLSRRLKFLVLLLRHRLVLPYWLAMKIQEFLSERKRG
ncbi:MAG: glycosyltransferase [Defluviitaleaceae bacterium]|nr:glycosyltransferase [Defluviitaleaceae bacterium]